MQTSQTGVKFMGKIYRFYNEQGQPCKFTDTKGWWLDEVFEKDGITHIVLKTKKYEMVHKVEHFRVVDE